MFLFGSTLGPQTQSSKGPASRLLPLLYEASNQEESGQDLSKMEVLLCACVIAVMYVVPPHILLEVSHTCRFQCTTVRGVYALDLVPYAMLLLQVGRKRGIACPN